MEEGRIEIPKYFHSTFRNEIPDPPTDARPEVKWSRRRRGRLRVSRRDSRQLSRASRLHISIQSNKDEIVLERCVLN